MGVVDRGVKGGFADPGNAPAVPRLTMTLDGGERTVRETRGHES
jgi:hypothetical protein